MTPSQTQASFQLLRRQGLESHQRGALAEAERLYRQALALAPADFATRQLLGVLLAQQGRNAEALVAISAALTLNPNSAPALFNQGNVLDALGRPQEALASFDRALRFRPGYAEALNNRGKVLRALGRLDEALVSFDQALAPKPDFAEAINNCGNVLLDLERPGAALASFDRAIALKPDHADLHGNIAIALLALNRPGEALASCDRAIALEPASTDAYINRGNALRDLTRPQEALESYDSAIRLKPDYAKAHSNRGNALLDLKRLAEALASYDRAIQLKPDYAEPHWNQSQANLLMGAFEKGFRQYEWRKKRDKPIALRSYPQPVWLGEEDITGKTLFLYWEQGLGDTIQFCRYAKLARARGIKVILSVQEPLAGLLKQLDEAIEIIGPTETPAHFAYHCPLLSLPLAFGTTLETIPSGAPYIAADKVWSGKERLGKNGKPNIGLTWSGAALHKNDRNRSIALEKFLPLLVPEANWISLQMDVRDSDKTALNSAGIIKHFGSELGDFRQTAALLDEMDLVITVDTAVAHLAGAMGKPAWILLPFSPDWRWLLDRQDSPWYPSVKLFRQPKIGDWEDVVERVRKELGVFIKDFG
jgi:tetratricopeptide (TPR) repeat protein